MNQEQHGRFAARTGRWCLGGLLVAIPFYVYALTTFKLSVSLSACVAIAQTSMVLLAIKTGLWFWRSRHDFPGPDDPLEPAESPPALDTSTWRERPEGRPVCGHAKGVGQPILSAEEAARLGIPQWAEAPLCGPCWRRTQKQLAYLDGRMPSLGLRARVGKSLTGLYRLPPIVPLLLRIYGSIGGIWEFQSKLYAVDCIGQSMNVAPTTFEGALFYFLFEFATKSMVPLALMLSLLIGFKTRFAALGLFLGLLWGPGDWFWKVAPAVMRLALVAIGGGRWSLDAAIAARRARTPH